MNKTLTSSICGGEWSLPFDNASWLVTLQPLLQFNNSRAVYSTYRSKL